MVTVRENPGFVLELDDTDVELSFFEARQLRNTLTDMIGDGLSLSFKVDGETDVLIENCAIRPGRGNPTWGGELVIEGRDPITRAMVKVPYSRVSHLKRVPATGLLAPGAPR